MAASPTLIKKVMGVESAPFIIYPFRASPSASSRILKAVSVDSYGTPTTLSSSSTTFPNRSLGEPDPDRLIVISLGIRSSFAQPNLTFSIGGVPMNKVYSNSLSANIMSFLLWAIVPNGTTGDFTIDNIVIDNSQFWTYFKIYRVIGGSETIVDSAIVSNTVNPSATLNTKNGGLVFATTASNPPGPAVDWSNATESYDVQTPANGDVISCAIAQTNGSPLSISATHNGAIDIYVSFCAVSFRPK